MIASGRRRRWRRHRTPARTGAQRRRRSSRSSAAPSPRPAHTISSSREAGCTRSLVERQRAAGLDVAGARVARARCRQEAQRARWAQGRGRTGTSQPRPHGELTLGLTPGNGLPQITGPAAAVLSCPRARASAARHRAVARLAEIRPPSRPGPRTRAGAHPSIRPSRSGTRNRNENRRTEQAAVAVGSSALDFPRRLRIIRPEGGHESSASLSSSSPWARAGSRFARPNTTPRRRLGDRRCRTEAFAFLGCHRSCGIDSTATRLRRER